MDAKIDIQKIWKPKLNNLKLRNQNCPNTIVERPKYI